MGPREAKDELFDTVAGMARALASPRRLELLDLLAQAPRTVEQLALAADQSSANASQHLQALHAAGLVERRREGNRVRYAIAGNDVIALLSTLQSSAAERIAEFDRAADSYLGRPVKSIAREELDRRLGTDGELVIVDVRPEQEFQAGHIDGAISIPIDQLPDRLADIPADAEVVAYCRGPLCAYAHAAVRELDSSGRNARLLDGGWTEWRLARQGTRRQTAA